MEIHQKSYNALLKRLPDLIRATFNKHDMHIMIQTQATTVSSQGRRFVTARECKQLGITHSAQVLAKAGKGAPYTLFEMPIMQNGVMLVKGQQRIVMLKKRRANVPARVGEYITALGAKVNVANRTVLVPGTTKWIPVAKCVPWTNEDPADLFDYVIEHQAECTWDTADMNATRVLTPGVLLQQLILHVLRSTKLTLRQSSWPHQHVSMAIESCIATGNWKGGMQGVTQLLNTNNALATEAHFKTVIGSNNDLDRYVHPSTYCLVCPSETPEGEKCGLVHHLTNNVRILDAVDTPKPAAASSGTFRLFWNGMPHGRTDTQPKGAHCVVRKHEIWAWTDGGIVVHAHTPNPKKHMLATAASTIPFAQHNQSPRISYYASMAKQAMPPGPGSTHQLVYAQNSLVSPVSNIGINVVVAVLPMGWNIEDALVFNKAAIDRGLFHSITNRTYRLQEQPPYLEGDVIPAGTKIAQHTTVFDETVMQVTVDTKGIYVMKTAFKRTPEVGDKFCSRAGQKGTIGRILPQTDMPFNQDGVTPDVVINPHAFPSRMTVSQIYETAAGLLNCYGCNIQGTPFQPAPDLQNMLKMHGFAPSGKEMMTSGITGEPLEARIFMGLCFYQRLHHLAAEKCYARKGGPVDQITHQPVAGRKYGGGLRLGEMEKDCLLAAGANATLEERMQSIGHTEVDICSKCAKIKTSCTCKMPHPPVHVSMPHASKLLLAELQAMGISVEIA